MVCDASFLASTIVSAFMNGLCCAWQTHEACKTRESIRHDIRNEYQRHRQKEQWQMMQSVYSSVDTIHTPALVGGPREQGLDDHPDERRRRLLRSKRTATTQCARDKQLLWRDGCLV